VMTTQTLPISFSTTASRSDGRGYTLLASNGDG
jgi:hypothetical protein